MITLPIDFIDNCLAYVGELFVDTTPIVLLVIGIPLGFYVINKVISLATTRARGARA